MIHAADEALQVRLAPDDVDSVQAAGVRFARAVAGAPTAMFMLALGEQEHLVRTAVEDAGFGELIAQGTATAFEVGARLEWGRIAQVTVRVSCCRFRGQAL